ncbi:MAG: 5-formyltetrahydrofolate cyclo-ligase [Pseudomonadota bacterium]
MEDLFSRKAAARRQMLDIRKKLTRKQREHKDAAIQESLFSFANFREARVVFFYVAMQYEVATQDMIQKSLLFEKEVTVPKVDPIGRQISIFRLRDMNCDLVPGYKGILEPDTTRTKQISIDQIDLAIIPGVAFDSRGGRLGQGGGYFDRFMPALSATTRKVGLAYECQIISQVPMGSHDKYVDIIITEKRVIYKI